jgi:hypothetical protein
VVVVVVAAVAAVAAVAVVVAVVVKVVVVVVAVAVAIVAVVVVVAAAAVVVAVAAAAAAAVMVLAAVAMAVAAVAVAAALVKRTASVVALGGRCDFAGLDLSMACGCFAFYPELDIGVRRRLGWAWGRLGWHFAPLRPPRFRRARLGHGLPPLRLRKGRFGYGLWPPRSRSIIHHLRLASVGLRLGSAWFARRRFAADPSSQGLVCAWLAVASPSIQKLRIRVRRRLSWAWGRLGLRVDTSRPIQFRRARFEYGLWLLRFFSRIIHLHSASVGLGLGSAGFARWPFAAAPNSQGSV